jgi:hypothetical protein
LFIHLGKNMFFLKKNTIFAFYKNQKNETDY